MLDKGVEMLENQGQIPYFFCNHCQKLSPVMGDPRTKLVCLICAASLDLTKAGRRVLFSEREATLRNLRWRIN